MANENTALSARFDDPNARHAYNLECEQGHGVTVTVRVEANNRDQAARIAEEYGYTVCSVNMVG